MRKLALILLLAALPLTAQSPAPSGFGFYPVADVSQCVPLPGAVITECVTTNKGAYYNSISAPTVFTQPAGSGPAPVTTVFGRAGDVKQQVGDYNFTQIVGQISAGQLPATTSCNISISSLTQDGKGNAAGTITLSSCH